MESLSSIFFREIPDQGKKPEWEQKRDEMIALIKKELSHILDDQWSIECIALHIPLASSRIFLGKKNREFRLSLLRDFNKQEGYYVARLEEIDRSGFKFLGSQKTWKPASQITKKELADFVFRETRLRPNSN